jgi:hypothetical protein
MKSAVSLQGRIQQSLEKERNLLREITQKGRSFGLGVKELGRLNHDTILLREVISVVRGESHVVHDNHIVTKLPTPRLLCGLEVIKHTNEGVEFCWNPAKLILMEAGSQSRPAASYAGDYSLLYFLMAKPFVIPTEWRNKLLRFGGIILSDNSLPVILLDEKGQTFLCTSSFHRCSAVRSHFDVYVRPGAIPLQYHS